MPPGYVDYRRREYCNDIRCPVQVQLNATKEGTPEHDEIRSICKEDCRFSADHFRGWLAAKKFIFLDPKTLQPVEKVRLDKIAQEQDTTWRFHSRTNAEGMLLVRPAAEKP